MKLGEVRFNLFTGPGFTVSNVEIADDPSVGIEPLAYVESLEARVTLRSFFTPQLSFSNLKLKNPTVNLVKNEQGTWNFQLLRAASGPLPGPPGTRRPHQFQIRRHAFGVLSEPVGS